MNASSDRQPADEPTEPSLDPGPYPEVGRLLGIDFGTKRIGIAVSTPEQTIASPLETYTRLNEENDAKHFAALVDEYAIAGLVVGLPVHMSGDESQKSREARTFGKWLGDVIGLPVCFHDERYTSAMAEDHLLAAELSRKKRKARIDKLAAQFILQSFLDASDRRQLPQPFFGV